MIQAVNVTLSFGGRTLFEDVNIQFTEGNCYGLIGANGAGKSTFLKILSGELESSKGEVAVSPGHRIAVLKQNHFEFDEFTVIDTVIMGHKRLYDIMKEKDLIYAKADFSDEDGIKASMLEAEFAELDGWDAEYQAQSILNGLGINQGLFTKFMKELGGTDKVKVLLAQALFGHPNILLLDEPTNHLDVVSITWLEDFIYNNLDNTVTIIVSHDRHFLNKVCTHIADVDYGKIKLYVGNYDFWYESSQLALRQVKEQNKKTEAKIKELQEFVQRFSANASKSKQATSRKKLLESLTIEDIRPSSRKYPFIDFKPDREAGNDILEVKNLYKSINGTKMLNNVSFSLYKSDKVAFLADNPLAITTLFKVLVNEIAPDSGQVKFGITITHSYSPKDNSSFFDGVDLSLIDWLRQYTRDQTETNIRGWLGRMLFSGDEALKKASVLSGGEKVRCMLSKMMLSGSNLLIMDDPTNHLDLESITALNNGLESFKGSLLFYSKDHQLIQTVANRIIKVTDDGIIDERISYDEFLEKWEQLHVT